MADGLLFVVLLLVVWCVHTSIPLPARGDKNKKYQRLKEKMIGLQINAMELTQKPVKLKFDFRTSAHLLTFLEKIS